jgi:voltage-gated potassium channel
LKSNSIEFAALLLPAVRAFRMFRVITAVSQFGQLFSSRAARANFYLFSSLPILFLMSALGIIDVERHAPGATIVSLSDALWWSLSTMATVGYGDLYPVTDSGRAIAAVLIFAGIGSMSLITANLASWISRNLGTRGSTENDLD